MIPRREVFAFFKKNPSALVVAFCVAIGMPLSCRESRQELASQTPSEGDPSTQAEPITAAATPTPAPSPAPTPEPLPDLSLEPDPEPLPPTKPGRWMAVHLLLDKGDASFLPIEEECVPGGFPRRSVMQTSLSEAVETLTNHGPMVIMGASRRSGTCPHTFHVRVGPWTMEASQPETSFLLPLEITTVKVEVPEKIIVEDYDDDSTTTFTLVGPAIQRASNLSRYWTSPTDIIFRYTRSDVLSAYDIEPPALP